MLQGMAKHPDLESCRPDREVRLEALTGAFAGWVLSFENPIGDADNWSTVESSIVVTPHTRRSKMHENRETRRVRGGIVHKTDMNAGEESR
jgi:hypothetical protein